jgi:hypothetical protein
MSKSSSRPPRGTGRGKPPSRKLTRANPEQCLLATRGKPHRINADVPELILALRREHSRKPDEIYARIERLVAGPYLELFSSSSVPHRPGWTHWIGKGRAAVRRSGSNSYPGAPETSDEGEKV